MFNQWKQWLEKILSFNIGNIFKMDMNNKIADSIKDSNLFKYNKNENTNNIIQQNFNIAILPNIDVDSSIKEAISLGNKNAQLAGAELQKLLKDNNIAVEQIQRKISDPDYLYTIAKANNIAYLTTNVEKRRVLSDLIYNKFASDDEVDSSTLSLAIRCMENLTNSHLKLNAFFYLLRSKYLERITSLEEFVEFYDGYISKLVNIPCNKIADIGTTLIGNGCAVTYTFGSSLEESFNKELASYISEFLKEENLSIQEQRQKNVIKQLNELWMRSGLTSAWPTAVGKCLAKTYLHNILNLDIDK